MRRFKRENWFIVVAKSKDLFMPPISDTGITGLWDRKPGTEMQDKKTQLITILVPTHFKLRALFNIVLLLPKMLHRKLMSNKS